MLSVVSVNPLENRITRPEPAEGRIQVEVTQPQALITFLEQLDSIQKWCFSAV